METALLLAQVKAIKAIPELKPLKPRQRMFIIAYAQCCHVGKASELTGIPWATHYQWRKDSPDYNKAVEFAKEVAGDFAEGDVYDRAYVGKDVERTRVIDGEVVIEKQKQKSDILAMFILKGLKPQYRDNWQVNNFVGPSQLNIGYSSPPPTIDVSPNSDQLKKLNDNKE